MRHKRERSDYYKSYDASHHEERRAKNAAYHAAHRDEILARSRARRLVKKDADNARKMAWRKAHQDEVRAETKTRYYSVPPEIRQARTKKLNAKYSKQRKAWREQNKERLAKLAAEWTKANSGLKRAATAKRLAAKIRATPKWADLETIKTIYREAARLTRATGVKHEVDHIIPLRSPLVCGLHISANMQILTRAENRRKWNKLAA